MSAAGGFVRLATAPGAVQVALGSRGAPVTERFPVEGWSRSAEVITSSLQFGPYPERIEADEVLVWIGGEGPDRLALSGRLGLPAGIPFLFDLSLSVSG